MGVTIVTYNGAYGRRPLIEILPAGHEHEVYRSWVPGMRARPAIPLGLKVHAFHSARSICRTLNSIFLDPVLSRVWAHLKASAVICQPYTEGRELLHQEAEKDFALAFRFSLAVARSSLKRCDVKM